MGKTCKLSKTCCVCKEDKHNLFFYSNKKGRTSLKPYCKSCRKIYLGIQSGFLPEEDFKGKNFDVSLLSKERTYMVSSNLDKGVPISYYKANYMINNGFAYIVSENKIMLMFSSLREYVFQRDQYICCYCGNTTTKKNRTIEHLKPRSKGGNDTPLNCVCACKTCNHQRGNVDLDVYMKKRGLSTLKNKKMSKLVLKDLSDFTLPDTKPNKPISLSNHGRTCLVCEVKKPNFKFPSQDSETCNKCSKFKEAFKKGYITKTRLQSLNTDSKEVKAPDGSVKLKFHESNGFIEISKPQAVKLVKIGACHVVSRGVIQYVFPNEITSELFEKDEKITINI